MMMKPHTRLVITQVLQMQWCCQKTNEFTGTSWDELQHIRQAVGFLTLHQKTHETMEEITNELCPIYRIGTMFWDGKYGTQGLSKDVIAKMRTMMTDDSTNNNTFLLDDDSRRMKRRDLLLQRYWRKEDDGTYGDVVDEN